MKQFVVAHYSSPMGLEGHLNDMQGKGYSVFKWLPNTIETTHGMVVFKKNPTWTPVK